MEDERGRTLIELLVAMGILIVMASVAIPHLKAYSVEAYLLGAGERFKGEFLRARSIAARSGAYTAIRFEAQANGAWNYSTWQDGNGNGVLKADIKSGKDVLVAGPFRLDDAAPGVRVGILPNMPAIAPDKGILSTADPVKFGTSNMLSFSPLGTATPGTFYLAGEGVQAAVRVNPGSARVRLMVTRGGPWRER